MFIVTLKYKVPIETIDQVLPAHLDWLRKHVDDGMVIASGRQIPAVGGIIITRNMPRKTLDDMLAHDPFVINKLADVAVTEFAPRNIAPLLTELVKDPLPDAEA